MKKLNITKEQFNRSRYFQRKYGKLEYVSESGKLFKTNKGKVLKFNESEGMGLSPDELDDELSAELDADEIKNDDFYDRGLERAMKDYGRKIARYAKAEAKTQLIGCRADKIELQYVKPEKKEIWYIINIRRASKKDNLDYSDIDDAFIENMYDIMFKSYGEFSGWEFPYEQYCYDGVMENGNYLPIAIGIKIDMDKVKVSKRHVDDARLDYLTGYEESTRRARRSARRFNESWNKDDYDDQPRKFRPKFDIGEKVSLTRSFYREFYDYYNDDPKKFKLDVDSIDDLPSDGWMIEDVKTEEGIEGATGLHRPYYSYYITNLDMDSGYEDDSIKGIWVYQDWIKSAEGSVKESTRRSARRFNESDERKECRSNIIRAYDSLTQAFRDYSSILEGSQFRQAVKLEKKIQGLIADFLADTSNSYGGTNDD